jgi:WD40 repeat protein
VLQSAKGDQTVTITPFHTNRSRIMLLAAFGRLLGALLPLALIGMLAACGPTIPATPTRGPLPTLADVPRRPPGAPLTVENIHEIESLGNLLGHGATVNHIAFAPAGRWMLTRDGAGDAMLWDLQAGRRQYVVGRDTVLFAAFGPGAETLLTVSPLDGVRFFRLSDGQLISSAPGNPEQTVQAAITPDGATLATGGIRGDLILWDVAGRRLIRRVPGAGSSVRAMTFAPDGARLAALVNLPEAGSVALRVWDVATGEPLPVPLDALAGLNPWLLAFTPAGDALAVVTRQQIRLYDLADFSLRYTLAPETLIAERAIAFSPDGRFMAATSPGDVVYVWLAADGSPAASLQGQQGAAMSLAFSPNSELLLTTNVRPGEGASVWQTQSFRPDAERYPHGRFGSEGSGILTGAWSPDGRLIVLAEASGGLMLWGIPGTR